MKNVGEVIKEERIRKKLSKEKLEIKTKIKKEFIEALESSRWDKLPDYPVVLGFVKNISDALGLREKNLTALLRRDYPPKTLRVNPKPELKDRFRWSPKITFIVVVGLLLLAVLFYLGFSYLNFIRPPFIKLIEPVENQLVEDNVLIVKGETKPEAFIEVNNQPVLVEDNGYFETEVEISEETDEIVVVARSRSGKETSIHRKIITGSTE